MHPIVTIGETRPGDPMERPYVTVPHAQWLKLEAASQREAALAEQLAEEKARCAAIVDNFTEYMRDQQVLIKLQREREGR